MRRVCEALQRRYGLPRLGNPDEPMDDLVYVITSNKTSPETAQSVYSQIKSKFQTWDKVLDAPPQALYSIVKPAGLATVKSKQIRDTLWTVREDLGSYNLGQLKNKPPEEVGDYLVSLPGVSEKVAKCVMMYTMSAEVLPVDSHVHRIATRLGWTARKRADQSHAELEALVPPKRRYAFHVDCVMHGRLVCRPKSPACGDCCISQYCPYYKSVKERG